MATVPEASSHVLQLNRATKIYPGAFGPAVDRLTLSLAQGEILSILGPSGCGKTTTLRLIAGFESLQEGEVSLRGRVVSTKHHLVPPEKREVAMVFQDYALFPHLTVAKNIAFGAVGAIAVVQLLKNRSDAPPAPPATVQGWG